VGLLLLGVGTSGRAGAQPPEAQLPAKTCMNKATIYLPVQMEEKDRANVREIQLYEKDDPARPWVLKDRKGPATTAFVFQPPRDGEYWFTVVTVDKQGRQSPADLSREGPGVIVVHDTQPPQVDLRQLQPTADGQWVQCEVRDANPDPARTRFEYQTTDQMWRAGQVVPGRADLFLIPAQANFNGMVRAVAVDRAGNTTEQQLNLTATAGNLSAPPAGGHAAPAVASQPPQPLPSAVHNQARVMASQNPALVEEGPSLASPAEKNVAPVRDPSVSPASNQVMAARIPSPPAPAATQPTGVAATGNLQVVAPPAAKSPAVPPAQGTGAPATRKVINATHVALDYQIDQIGASGVGKVEVWATPDQGQSWQRLGEDSDRRSPVEIDLPGEGLYGVSLVVSNGRGFGANPPSSGDAPDWWIEVDVTKPAVELSSVRPGSGDEGGALWISWTARDKNLSSEPIDLYYSINREGPWVPIAKGIRNDGRYRWAVPQEIGPLAFIRVVATDKAGNSSKCDSPHAVALDDMSRPHGHVVGIASQADSTATPAAH
jgi:hypothetical protein